MYKVLIIEDSIRDLNGLVNHINWEELSCTIADTAADGEQGLKKALRLKPDIIITDISMPSMDGIEMTKEILKSMPNTQFIFMTAFDDFTFAHEAIKLNVCDYILKPISLPLMTEAIKKARQSLDDQRLSRQKEKQLNRLLHENLDAVKESLLINVLTTKNETDTSFAQYLDMMPDTEYHFIVFEIFDISSSSIQQKFSYQLQLKKILRELFGNLSGMIYAAYSDSFIVMVLPTGEIGHDELIGMLSETGETFKNIASASVRTFLYFEAVSTDKFNKLFEMIYTAIVSMAFSTEDSVTILDEPDLTVSSGSKDSIATKIYSFIEKNYHHFDAVNEAIKEHGISLNYANILFKQKYNSTIFEHLVYTRIEIAKKMLRDGQVRIYEIAEKVGYTSNTYFSTAFRQYTGLSPKEYRMINKDCENENSKE